jgi:hypothetical protein
MCFWTISFAEAMGKAQVGLHAANLVITGENKPDACR